MFPAFTCALIWRAAAIEMMRISLMAACGELTALSPVDAQPATNDAKRRDSHATMNRFMGHSTGALLAMYLSTSDQMMPATAAPAPRSAVMSSPEAPR